MSQIPKHRQLPDKENRLFKELLTQYELKQYKKGLKGADTILKKFPNHGETIAIKALILHASLPFPPTVGSVPKAEEAEALARLGVKKDITSHITWHVLGILAKARKDWDEATRAFAMARKQDNDNIPLIRDSISLYLHTRQYPQAVAARHHHLLLRPNMRSTWTSLIVAHHLNGDLDEAIEVYDTYAGIMQTDGSTAPEKAQLLLYIVRLCLEAGHERDGLHRLEMGIRSGTLSARGEATMLKAEMLVKLGSMDEAEVVWRQLVEQNPDDLEYYRGFLRTRDLDITGTLSPEKTTKVLSHLTNFAQSYPRSPAPRRLALTVAEGDTFRQEAKKYLVAGLEKGIPSLFVDVKGIYANPEKMAIVGEIVEEVVKQLEAETSLHNDESRAPPTALLWAYYYLALHLSHPSHPNPSHERSLALLDTALKHTPTLPEIYMAKAMVLKRAGDLWRAAQCMEEARLLDGQDRFLNSKAGKYWLRAGEVDKSIELLGLFTKPNVVPAQDLLDMQCLWWLVESGDSYRWIGNLAMALKRYQALVTVFQEYEDDQYDFHTYCMRRMTFSTYIALMKYEDQLRSHPAYFKAALAAISIYIRIYDDPSLTEEKLTAEDEAEKKKAAKKAQKAEQKAKKAAAASGEGKKDDQPVPDADPKGEKLLKTETPLDDALKIWKPLEKLAGRRIEVWTSGFELFLRKNLILAALRCLLKAAELDPQDPKLHWEIVQFRAHLTKKADLPPAVSAAASESLQSLLPSATSSESFNESFLSRHSTSPPHIVGGAKGSYAVSGDVESAIKILNTLTDTGVPSSIPCMLEGLELLRQSKAPTAVQEAFRERCRGRLPLATVFGSEAEQKRLREEVLTPEHDGTMVNGSGSKADV